MAVCANLICFGAALCTSINAALLKCARKIKASSALIKYSDGKMSKNHTRRWCSRTQIALGSRRIIGDGIMPPNLHQRVGPTCPVG